MNRAALEKVARRACAELAERGKAPASMTLVAAFFEAGVCLRIQSWVLGCEAPGASPAIPDAASESIARWGHFASHVLLAFADPGAARPYGSAALHDDEGFAHVVRITLGDRVLHYCPPAHDAWKLVAMLRRHAPESRQVLNENLRWDLEEGARAEPALLPAASFLHQPGPLSRTRCLSRHFRALHARGGLADRDRKVALVRGRLRAWLATQRDERAVAISPRTFAESPPPESAEVGLQDFTGVAEFERRFASRLSERTSASIASALQGLAKLPRDVRADRLLNALCDEVFRLQIASPALDFHYPDWRRFRGAVRMGRLDERIDLAANRRILAALDKIAGAA